MQGGKRKGAGRKKGFAALKAEEARAFIAQAVSQELGLITAALVKKAKHGDVRAAQILLERAYGKPIEASGSINTFEPITSIQFMASHISEEQMYKIAKIEVERHEATLSEPQ
jgi:hypothetical protein